MYYIWAMIFQIPGGKTLLDMHNIFHMCTYFLCACPSLSTICEQRYPSVLNLFISIGLGANFYMNCQENGKQTILQLGRVGKSKYVMDYRY